MYRPFPAKILWMRVPLLVRMRARLRGLLNTPLAKWVVVYMTALNWLRWVILLLRQSLLRLRLLLNRLPLLLFL